MAIEVWRIGDVEVRTIVDLDPFDLPLRRLLPGVEPDALERYRALLVPDHVDPALAHVRLAIQAFLLQVDGLSILVDTCVGEHKPRPRLEPWNERRNTGFLDRLRQAGVPAETIDVVFCTHLHADHFGWNTRLRDGRWVPTFAKARYLFCRREFAHWSEQTAANHGSFHDSVLPIAEAGQMVLIDDGYALARGVTVVPLPGHSPGQVGLAIDRGGVRALFCGDAIHSPIQIVAPDLSSAFCNDPEGAATLRRRLLTEASETGGLLVPAHFRGSGRVHIRRDVNGYSPLFAGSRAAT